MFWKILGKKKIGLVLGGGVTRGMAHIGVLKVLKKYEIPVECIAAVSSGSLVGVGYAAGLDAGMLEKIALYLSWRRLIRLSFFQPGLITSDKIEQMIYKYIGNLDFHELKVPIAVIATSLVSGEPLVISKGKIANAVVASSAFPGLFVPAKIYGGYAVDGSISNNLPVDVVQEMGANFIIAVDVIPPAGGEIVPQNALDVFGKSLDLVLHRMSLPNRNKADILIEPKVGQDMWMLDRAKAQQLIAAGEEAAEKALANFKLD